MEGRTADVVGEGNPETCKVPRRRGQVHVFGRPFPSKMRLLAGKMEQSPDFADLLVVERAVLRAPGHSEKICYIVDVCIANERGPATRAKRGRREAEIQG